MVDARVEAVADAFDELFALATSEPALADFVEPARELRRIGREARFGREIALTVSPERRARIPSRALAARIVEIVSRTPGPLEDADPGTIRTMALLHGNLVRAFVHAVLCDYPDLMRE